jgi:hypothetical protein
MLQKLPFFGLFAIALLYVVYLLFFTPLVDNFLARLRLVRKTAERERLDEEARLERIRQLEENLQLGVMSEIQRRVPSEVAPELPPEKQTEPQ